MIETPLHHCYLISASDTTAGMEKLVGELKELFAGDELKLSIDQNVVDTFTIEQARELSERGAQKATGEARCIVRAFSTVTRPAQNALLKVIEAPAAGTHFFFITPEVDNLLETVRSRAHELNDFYTAAPDENISVLISDFLATDKLTARLNVMEKLKTTATLRQFIKLMATKDLPRENARFGHALELAADWATDAGASRKMLGQFLATASLESPPTT